MPRCFSISIQSEVAWRVALRAFTEPAIWIAPENSSSFSVSVVLPASGWEMMAKVRRRRVSEAKDTRVPEECGGGLRAAADRAAIRRTSQPAGRRPKERDFTRPSSGVAHAPPMRTAARRKQAVPFGSSLKAARKSEMP